MEPKALLSFCFFLIFSISNLSAQTVSSNSVIIDSETEIIVSIDADLEWAFLEDTEDQKVYIDFSELGGNFAELVVQDDAGNEVFREDLFDMPSDSIYELDLSKFNSGEYTIELKTYTKPIYRTISVK